MVLGGHGGEHGAGHRREGRRAARSTRCDGQAAVAGRKKSRHQTQEEALMQTTLPSPRLALAAGALPASGTLCDPYPYETVQPSRDGYVNRESVRSWYAQYGATGPWLAFAPIYQIANSHLLRGVVPWLSQHFRVVVMALRGNGR